MHLAELYPDQALRFCGLSECLRLGGPARLVSRFIYTLVRGFEELGSCAWKHGFIRLEPANLFLLLGTRSLGSRHVLFGLAIPKTGPITR